jgi:hypothetical protein
LGESFDLEASPVNLHRAPCTKRTLAMRHITEPERAIDVIHETDILVARYRVKICSLFPHRFVAPQPCFCLSQD